jgi:hypothetical protein
MEFCDSIIKALVTGLPFPIGGLLSIFVVMICFVVGIIFLLVYAIFYYTWPVLVPAALITAALNWEFFFRLYYELTPHPTASMVNDAIRSGVQFDAQAFADILQPATGPQVRQDVRNAQAMKLAEMARMSNEQLRRTAEELQRQVAEQGQYQAAHGELLDAMMAQRVAKARADAYAKAAEFWKTRRKTG